MTFSFAVVIVMTRYRREVSMMPATCASQALVIVVVAPVRLVRSATASDWRIFAALGIFQMGIGLAFSPSERASSPRPRSRFSLLEVVLGPLWVWLAYAERPSTSSLVGGAIVTAAIVVQATARDLRCRCRSAPGRRCPSRADLTARRLGAVPAARSRATTFSPVVALDLDRVALHCAAGAALPLEVGGDGGEVAVEATHHRHGLAASAALLAEDPRHAVLRERRATCRRWASASVDGLFAAAVTVVAWSRRAGGSTSGRS